MNTPAASRAATLPRYTEWTHLREKGQWSDLVPKWAKDHSGQMNDTVAARAVIEELAEALEAAQPASPAPLTDEQVREAFRASDSLSDPMRYRTPWQVWRDAFAAFAALASPQVAPTQQKDGAIWAAIEKYGDACYAKALHEHGDWLKSPDEPRSTHVEVNAARDELLALTASPQVAPEGWRLVPINPTTDMLYEAQDNAHILPSRARRIWNMMLDAAPAAPVQVAPTQAAEEKGS